MSLYALFLYFIFFAFFFFLKEEISKSLCDAYTRIHWDDTIRLFYKLFKQMLHESNETEEYMKKSASKMNHLFLLVNP